MLVFFCRSSFVANLFNTYPALDPPTTEQVIEAGAVIEPGVVIEETREEKTYRNFINSFGFDPHVNYLYSDLCDGLIILQVNFIFIKLQKKNIPSKFSSMILSVQIPLIGRKYIKLLRQSKNVFKN